jgi:Protein of unknown function (DUF2800)
VNELRSSQVENRGVNTPPEPAHSQFGGSSAPRVRRCPGSVVLGQQAPAFLRNRSSVYANRGTALHAAMALLLGDNPPALDDLVGQTFGDYTLTPDDVETALRPTYAYVIALLDIPGAEYYLERRVVFPNIPGAFGTVDLIIRIGATLYVVDFKFGSGVRVLALYPDGDVDVINAQLLFYGVGTRHTLPDFVGGVDKIVLMILQPTSIEPDAELVSSVTITHDELNAFTTVYRAVCEEALAPAPRLARGDWCRWCVARPICPLHTGPLLDLALFALPTAAPPVADAAYLQLLADGLNLVDAVKDVRAALHDQAKLALENGYAVPGYALTAGRAERHWRDDEPTAIAALQNLGLNRDDIIAETMRSVKQVEIRAKARGLKVPQELIASSRSGVSLVRAENARVPAPGRDELVRTFSAAVQHFQTGETL